MAATPLTKHSTYSQNDLEIDGLSLFWHEVPGWVLENGSAFELHSIQIKDCNLAVWLMESKCLKTIKAIW